MTIEERIEALEVVAREQAERERLLQVALTRLADAIASAGYNINTDDMHNAYRAVWEYTGEKGA